MAKRLLIAADVDRALVARGGVWRPAPAAPRHELRHPRLGIIGLGEVGRRVAGLAAAFGVHVAAFDPYIGEADFAARGAVRIRLLDELLRASDIVTLHVPLSKETRGMIGRAEILLMPRGAVVINAARGEV